MNLLKYIYIYLFFSHLLIFFISKKCVEIQTMLYLKKIKLNLIHLGGFHLIEEPKYTTTNYCAKI